MPFAVALPAVEILQEMQVILGVAEYFTDGRVLEAALVWYDEMSKAGDALRFSPPSEQRHWRSYSRSLLVDPGDPPAGPPKTTELMVGGEALRRLATSEKLLGLATPVGLEKIIRLKAEYVFRLADDWSVESENERWTQA
jgi:hypothetical protein